MIVRENEKENEECMSRKSVDSLNRINSVDLSTILSGVELSRIYLA